VNRLIYLCGFGVAGILSRYYLGVWFSRAQQSAFPWATLAINLSGSFLIGVVFVLGLEHSYLGEDLRIGVMVGFLGGYTTFSSYCLESSRMLEAGEWRHMAAYFILSPLLGLALAMGGMFLTRLLLKA
jgi:CrcB protein